MASLRGLGQVHVQAHGLLLHVQVHPQLGHGLHFWLKISTTGPLNNLRIIFIFKFAVTSRHVLVLLDVLYFRRFFNWILQLWTNISLYFQ